MEEFKEFLQKLFLQLSTGNYVVMVECAGGEQFSAVVIGYSEEYMTVKVRFHSDELTKPGTREVKVGGFGYGTEEVVSIEPCRVPVKVEDIWWESIKLT